MENNHIDLTATEIGYLWSSYQSEKLTFCMLTYFDSIITDQEIKQINGLNLESCKDNIKWLESLFQNEEMPIPLAFGETDINFTNDRLYTDPFILYYQWFICKGNINFASLAINTIARDDIFNFYHETSTKVLNILNQSRKLLLKKGLWLRAPYIPLPKKVEFIKKESFLNDWFGEQRPLAGIEIASLFYNILTNTLGLSLINSFIQVTSKGEIKDYFIKGKKLAEKHINALSEQLKNSGLQVPNIWNAGVTDSTQSPFSNKLMLSLISFLNAQGTSNYGNALSTSIRTDIGVEYAKLMTEVGAYAKEGANLLIDNGWFPAPPQAKKVD